MKVTVEDLLHARIGRRCLDHWSAGQYRDAVKEAMVQVEQAVSERDGMNAGSTPRYGAKLNKPVFEPQSGLRLRVAYDGDLQEKAGAFFDAARRFHSEVAAREQETLDGTASMRALVLASELLDLIGAPAAGHSASGIVRALVDQDVFKSAEIVAELLSFLDGYLMAEKEAQAFYEDLRERGFNTDQLRAVVDLGLVEFAAEPSLTTENDVRAVRDLREPPAAFTLTALGEAALRDLTA
jgi:hypothetical protein